MPGLPMLVGKLQAANVDSFIEAVASVIASLIVTSPHLRIVERVPGAGPQQEDRAG